MRPRPLTGTALAFAAALAAGACDDAVAPDPPIRIEIAGDTTVAVGQSILLSVRGYGASGGPVAVPAVSWRILDALVAEVSGSGVLTGRSGGRTGVVASAGEMADTAWVRVHASDLGLGRMAGVIAGVDTAQFEWSGLARVRDVLGTADGDQTLVFAEAPAHDSAVVVRIPAVLEAGHHEIGAYPLQGAPVTGPSALVVVPGPGGERVYYSVAGGTLDVGAADYPARPGLWFGAARLTLAFRATRYLVGEDGAPVPSGDTITVRAEAHLHLQHLLAPAARLTLEGGPAEGVALRTVGHAAEYRGGLLVWWDADLDGLPQSFPWEVSHGFWIATPAGGEHAVHDLAPEVHQDPAAWPALFSELYYRDHALTGLSDAGTLVITRYLAPSDTDYGEIHGTLTVTLELWDADGASTGERVQAAAAFAIPLNPGGGVPN